MNKDTINHLMERALIGGMTAVKSMKEDSDEIIDAVIKHALSFVTKNTVPNEELHYNREGTACKQDEQLEKMLGVNDKELAEIKQRISDRQRTDGTSEKEVETK